MNLSLVTANQKTAITTYVSRGVKISQSCHHKDMFIFTFPDGGFFSIHSSAEAILKLHPKDIVENFKEELMFKFNHTSNYKPIKQPIEKWQREQRFTTRLN